MSLSVTLCLIINFFMKTKSKYYMFGSLLEYFQVIYFMAFLSINKPSLI